MWKVVLFWVFLGIGFSGRHHSKRRSKVEFTEPLGKQVHQDEMGQRSRSSKGSRHSQRNQEYARADIDTDDGVGYA